MRLKGIILTLDAMFALAFAAVVLSLAVVVSQNSIDFQHFNELSVLGRDYLVLKYFHNKSITASDFASLTRNSITETEPSDSNYWVASVYYKYPNYFNCTNSTSCSFNKSSVTVNYSNSQDAGIRYKYLAWVTP